MEKNKYGIYDVYLHLGHTSVMVFWFLGCFFFLLTSVLEKCLDLCVHMGWQIPLVPGLTLVMAELAAAAAPNAHTEFGSEHFKPSTAQGLRHPDRADRCSAELRELLVPVLGFRLS